MQQATVLLHRDKVRAYGQLCKLYVINSIPDSLHCVVMLSAAHFKVRKQSLLVICSSVRP